MHIQIDKNRKHQKFEGFGASGAWWAQEVGGWTHTDAQSGMPVRDRISQLLYDRVRGIGLRIYRYNLGSGSKQSGKGHIKNALRRTESFETSAGVYDFTQDQNAVYMMKQAVKDGAKEVVLFANSPIERLTKNGSAHCSKHKAFQDNLSKKNYHPFAKYCLDVTEHFVKQGVPVQYLSPVNEPIWTWTGGQEGCHYHPKSAGQVLKTFADEMDKRSRLADVKLAGLESGDIRWFNKTYTRNLLKYTKVRKRIDSVDIHSYFLHPVPIPFFSRTAYMKRYRSWLDRHYPDTAVKMSEWCHMQKGRDAGMQSALVMAKIIYEDISILNVTAWSHWVAVSEVDYCDGLIYINLEDKSFEMTKRYYATGNFSKYIPYHAVRIAAKTDDAEIKLLAFEKGDKIILILINDTEKEKTVSLNEEYRGVTLAVTDEKDDLKEYAIQNADIKISAKSVNTIVLQALA